MVGPPGTGKIDAGRALARHPAADDRGRSAGIGRGAIAGRRLFDRSAGRARPTARRTTPPPAWRWSAAAATRAPAKSRWRITACCFSTNCRNSTAACWKCLREPLESGRITISRAARQADFPARFQLVAAMNPCPCGYLGHASGKCRCTPDIRWRAIGARSPARCWTASTCRSRSARWPHEDLLRQADGEPSSAVHARASSTRLRGN